MIKRTFLANLAIKSFELFATHDSSSFVIVQLCSCSLFYMITNYLVDSEVKILKEWGPRPTRVERHGITFVVNWRCEKIKTDVT